MTNKNNNSKRGRGRPPLFNGATARIGCEADVKQVKQWRSAARLLGYDNNFAQFIREALDNYANQSINPAN